jgi:RecA/RadA recombinase
VGRLGFPNRSVHELYGKPEKGKSSLALYLAGCVCAPKDRIIYNWLESFDANYLLSASGQSGWDGVLKLVDHWAEDADPDKDPPKDHADMLKEGAQMLWDVGTSAYILDSLAEVRSRAMSDPESAYDEAFMGQRAKLIGMHVMDLEGIVNDKAGAGAVAILLNHVHPDFQNKMAFPMYITPGGVKKEFASVSRIHLKSADPKTYPKIEGVNITHGVVEKLRFGMKGREFVIAIIPGVGVSAELTALLDAAALKLIERGQTIKVEGKSLGRLGDLVEAAAQRDSERFAPIFQALQRYERENYDVSNHHQDPRGVPAPAG